MPVKSEWFSLFLQDSLLLSCGQFLIFKMIIKLLSTIQLLWLWPHRRPNTSTALLRAQPGVGSPRQLLQPPSAVRSEPRKCRRQRSNLRTLPRRRRWAADAANKKSAAERDPLPVIAMLDTCFNLEALLSPSDNWLPKMRCRRGVGRMSNIKQEECPCSVLDPGLVSHRAPLKMRLIAERSTAYVFLMCF